MNTKLSISVLLLCIGVGTGAWYYQSTDSDAVHSVSAVPESVDSPEAVVTAQPSPPPIVHNSRDLLQEKIEQRTERTAVVTDEDKQRVAQDEAELLAMAAKYDAVRSDPELREQHRTAMKEKLAEYSQSATPVILEQIRKQQAGE